MGYTNPSGSGNNGNVYSVVETQRPNASAPNTAFTQTYTYDTLNRLWTASDTGGWSESFGYDQYGNAFLNSSTGLPVQSMATNISAYSAATNRLTSGSYDTAGNQTVIGGETIVYDAESRQKSVTQSGATATYGYDGDGRRVTKTVGGATTTYVYDASGKLKAEYNSGAATTPPRFTCYLSADYLGSTRMVTDQNAQIVSWHDYLPFGGEILSGTAGRTAPWGGSDFVSQKFTGKERDAESGLGWWSSRYYGSAPGRFTSPDPIGLWGAKLFDPSELESIRIRSQQPASLHRFRRIQL